MNTVVVFNILRGREHLVIFGLRPGGRREIPLPKGKSVEDVWPRYAEIETYVQTWFEQNEGRIRAQLGDSVDEERYQRALAAAFTTDGLMKMWACVTIEPLWVSFRQVGLAMGRQPTRRLREELEKKGLRFTKSDKGRYAVMLPKVTRVLGEAVADRILLYPYQVANRLGISRRSVSGLVKRLGIGLGTDCTTLVPWGKLRYVYRVGPRKFEVRYGQSGVGPVE